MKTWHVILGTPALACILFFAGYGLARWAERVGELVVHELPAAQRAMPAEATPQPYGFQGIAPRGGRVR